MSSLPRNSERRYRGLIVSPGVAIGRIFVLKEKDVLESIFKHILDAISEKEWCF
jgi:signal transduction protein with GAF and PtsI domain